MNIDKKKVTIGIISIILGILASIFGQPFIHNNANAVNVLVTVYSILAGFLIAIIAIIGDPALLPSGTWRAAEIERTKTKNRLIRHKWLFLVYLITLALIFLSFLIDNKLPLLTKIIEHAYIGIGAIAFFLSMQLPHSLMKIQQERIDSIIEHRRSNEDSE